MHDGGGSMFEHIVQLLLYDAEEGSFQFVIQRLLGEKKKFKIYLNALRQLFDIRQQVFDRQLQPNFLIKRLCHTPGKLADLFNGRSNDLAATPDNSLLVGRCLMNAVQVETGRREYLVYIVMQFSPDLLPFPLLSVDGGLHYLLFHFPPFRDILEIADNPVYPLHIQ